MNECWLHSINYTLRKKAACNKRKLCMCQCWMHFYLLSSKKKRKRKKPKSDRQTDECRKPFSCYYFCCSSCGKQQTTWNKQVFVCTTFSKMIKKKEKNNLISSRRWKCVVGIRKFSEHRCKIKYLSPLLTYLNIEKEKEIIREKKIMVKHTTI